MPESKRIFNRGSVDRDIDDRLLPEGKYRDALNVNVGVSEGGDIGAVENLKGNEQVGTVTTGTTIGSVRDPNNDKVYWFNTSATVDAIYEYDEATGEVNTIVIDDVSRPLVKPTCTPNLVSFITEPDSDDSVRPELAEFPTPPVGGCDLSPTTHTSSNGNFFPGGGAFADRSLCVLIPVAPTFSLRVDGGGTHIPDTITLRAVPTNGTGPFTYVWNGTDDDTVVIDTNTITGMDGETFNGTAVVTDSTSATATANWSVNFNASSISFTVSSSGDFAGATRGPASSETFGVPPGLSFTTTQVLDNGFMWTSFPTVADPNVAGLSLTQSMNPAATDNLQATLTGTPLTAGSANLAWSGGVTGILPGTNCQILDEFGGPVPASIVGGTVFNGIFRFTSNISSNMFNYGTTQSNGRNLMATGTPPLGMQGATIAAGVNFDVPFSVMANADRVGQNLQLRSNANISGQPPGIGLCSTLEEILIT